MNAVCHGVLCHHDSPRETNPERTLLQLRGGYSTPIIPFLVRA
jgi:hypothetical protein